MNRIRLKTIRYQNVLSAGNGFIEVQLDSHKTTIITGKNGDGKSQLGDAIFYALFGEPYRDIKLDLFINSINRSKLLVELEFSSGSKQYLVRRGKKPDLFEIHENGILVEQQTNKKFYQSYLEKSILGFNRKSARQIMFLGSRNYVPFMKLVKAERRQIIEDLLDIEIFSTMLKVAKERQTETKKSLTDKKNAMEGLKGKIELQQKYIEESQKNNGELIDQKNTDIKTSETEVEKCRGRITVHESIIKTLEPEIKQLQETITDEPKLKTDDSKLAEFRAQFYLQIKTLSTENQFFEGNDNCPKCKQSIDNKEEIVGQNNNKITEINTGLEQVNQKRLVISKRQTEISKVYQQISEIQRQIQTEQTEIAKIQTEIRGHQNQITKAQSEITKLAVSGGVSSELEAEREKMKTEMLTLVEDGRKLVNDDAYNEMLVLMLQDNGIKSRIIKQYLPIINKTLNKYLEIMNFNVNIQLDEEFGESFKSRGRDEWSYNNLSEGQKMRVDLAFLFTWRMVAKVKNSLSCNALLMDEIFDSSLDADGVEDVAGILNSLEEDSNIIVVSHRQNMDELFERHIRFKKVGDFSEMEMVG